MSLSLVSSEYSGHRVVNVLDSSIVSKFFRKNGDAMAFAFKNNLDTDMVIARMGVEQAANRSCYALENESF